MIVIRLSTLSTVTPMRTGDDYAARQHATTLTEAMKIGSGSLQPEAKKAMSIRYGSGNDSKSYAHPRS